MGGIFRGDEVRHPTVRYPRRVARATRLRARVSLADRKLLFVISLPSLVPSF